MTCDTNIRSYMMKGMIGGTTTLEELISSCTVDALEALDDASLASFATAVLEFWPRLDAARLRLLAVVGEREAFRADGARDAASWLAWRAGERRAVARRELELAAAVVAMPTVETGLAAGVLSRAKAAELGRAAGATPDEQEALVAAAATQAVEELAHEVDRWQLQHQVATEVDDSCKITSAAGGGRIEATLSTEGLEWVQVAVDAAADQLGLTGVPWPERRAKGLVAVCRHFLDHAEVPTRRHGRPTVVVTMDLDTLAARTGGVARMDAGGYVSGETARRLACDAGVVRMITGPDSMPLDLGRLTRSISPAQARAVIHRDRHCRYEGCHAPPWACEVHHLDHWAHGGRTDLDRLGLLCWHHHQLTHRQEATHELVELGQARLRLQPRRRGQHSDAA